MTYDSANEQARQLPMPSLHQVEEYVLQQSQALVPVARRRGKPATAFGAAFMPGDCAVWLRGLWVATQAVATPLSGTDRALCAGVRGGSGRLQPAGAGGRSDARVL